MRHIENPKKPKNRLPLVFSVLGGGGQLENVKQLKRTLQREKCEA
jgi:hypothetical protein